MLSFKVVQCFTLQEVFILTSKYRNVSKSPFWLKNDIKACICMHIYFVAVFIISNVNGGSNQSGDLLVFGFFIDLR